MEEFNSLLSKVRKDNDIMSVILYGSYIRGESYRDIDICLVVDPKRIKSVDIARKGLDYMKRFDYDIHIYQELPLYIQTRILKEGRPLLVKDEDKQYDIAKATISEFEYFKLGYGNYLEGVLNG